MTKANITVEEAYQAALQFFNTGKLAVANEIAVKILQEYPAHSNTLTLRGVILNTQHAFRQAIVFFQKSLEQNENNYNAHHNLGISLLELKRYDESIEHLAMAVTLVSGDSELVATHTCLGNAYAMTGNFSKAEENHLAAMALKPEDFEVLSNLGALYVRWKKYAEAVAILLQATSYAADNYEILCNLGNAYLEQAEYAAAEEWYRKALDIDASNIKSYANLSFSLREQGRLQEAKQLLHRAIAIAPKNAELHWNLSLILLMEEDFSNGWPEYEWRKHLADIKSLNIDGREWKGEKLDGKTLLVHFEQGLGDSIQFLRFIVLVKQRYRCRVIFQCQAVLMALLSHCKFIDQLIPHNTTAVGFDVHIALMSLPHILSLNQPEQLDLGSYLSFDRHYHQVWSNKIDQSSDTLKVGICWQGNPSYRGDKHRSIPLTFFTDLVQIPGAEFFSLQKGFGVEQLAGLPANFVQNIGETIDDNSGAFVETSGALSCLDLIISSDTSLPHLAAAMGKPVWLLLCQVPDWRWGIDGETTPWYQSMRLFRQMELGRWGEVFSDVQRELEMLVQQKTQL